MVTVTGYKTRLNSEKEEFIVLELTGSLEIVQSQNTGKWYCTVRRCSIPSTFDEEIAKLMVGSRIEGEIVRVPCEDYEYTVKRTGEVVSLAYTYSFMPPGAKEHVGHGEVVVEETLAPAKPVDAIAAAGKKQREKLVSTK